MAEPDDLRNAVNHAFAPPEEQARSDECRPSRRCPADRRVHGWHANNHRSRRSRCAILRHSVNVHVGEASVLDSKGDDHEAWLPARRGAIKWSFWKRYRWYLENEKGIPAEVVERMEEVTDMILERLEDPQRPAHGTGGAWSSATSSLARPRTIAA